MKDKIVVPKFQSEGEEAEWWFVNREEHGALMAREIEQGRSIAMVELLKRSCS